MPSTTTPSRPTPQTHDARNASASPPPTKPTPLAPGIRASALQKVYSDALASTLRNVSYPNFAACFPTPATHVPEALDGLHRDFVGKLEEVCKTEFTALLEERDVVRGLNELDELIADAKRRRERALQGEGQGNGQEGVAGAAAVEPPTPPHLLPPSALLAAHMTPFLDSQTEHLTKQLEQTQRSNLEISEEISGQRETIENTIGGLENLIRDIEGAAKALNGSEMEGVEADLETAATAS